MARISIKGQLLGTVGPVAFRTYNGKAIAQSKPGRGNVKQTAATKSVASDFGSANTMSKKIRTAVIPILQHYAEPDMHRRLTTKIFEVLLTDTVHPKGSRKLSAGDVSLLERFQFNTKTPYHKYCTLSPKITYGTSQNIVLSLLSFDPKEVIKAIPDATDAELCVLATAFDRETFEVTGSEIFKLAISLGGEAVGTQQWETAAGAENTLMVVAVALYYFKQNGLVGMIGLNNKDMGPCEVLRVVSVGG